jgi:uncharacterized protein YgbK (DUF1537 family)
MNVLVIADDFTGAAEVAGIGWRFGLPTQLLRGERTRPAAGLTVIDSDTRLLSDSAAADRVSAILERSSGFNLVYKKIDSALRGPVRSEVYAALRALGMRSAALVPQNPSRGRVIRQGFYFVDDQPLQETEFAADPHHPALTSDVRDRIGLSYQDESIEIRNAVTLDQVEAIAQSLNVDELPVGGADFFSAVLRHRIGNPPPPPPVQFEPGGKLFVCGTTTRQRASLLKNAIRQNFALCPMTDHTSIDEDFSHATVSLENNRNALLYFDGPVQPNQNRAEDIQKRFATAVQMIMSRGHVRHLLVEGGATAAAVCQRFGWTRFEVAGEIAQGIVALRGVAGEYTRPTESAGRAASPLIVVKPGSYAWPCEVLD